MVGLMQYLFTDHHIPHIITFKLEDQSIASFYSRYCIASDDHLATCYRGCDGLLYLENSTSDHIKALNTSSFNFDIFDSFFWGFDALADYLDTLDFKTRNFVVMFTDLAKFMMIKRTDPNSSFLASLGPIADLILSFANYHC
jgi:hypothetical protein